jgi:hypothetical protein
MQLNTRRRARIGRTLGLLTANLFVAAGVHAQDVSNAPAPDPASIDGGGANDDTQNDLGMTRIDSAVLFYQEDGGRVRTIEPVVNATLNSSGGDVLSIRLTSDTLTGATPNGAAPWTGPQTFTTPAHAHGTSTTVTGASGGSTLITIPGVGTVVRQYTIAPNQLPVDAGFRDQRFALDLGYSTQWNPDTKFSAGGGASIERDYTSLTASLGASRDLNNKNTTVSAVFNFEYDLSHPYFGTPTPFTVMNGLPKGGNASKNVYNVVLGVSQVLNRRWLAQLNYSIGSTNGYQTDPYRVISVVDSTGAPLQYLYENRPNSRIRQSVYFGNKISIGPTFADISARYYRDNWGISSVTVAAAERIPIIGRVYIEPEARYYTQTAANFFHDYLVGGQPLPAFASSDSRLDKFSAVTFGARIGVKVSHTGEFYLQGERYNQSGNAHPAGAIGALANENLFSGASSTSVIVGYTFAFF